MVVLYLIHDLVYDVITFPVIMIYDQFETQFKNEINWGPNILPRKRKFLLCLHTINHCNTQNIKKSLHKHGEEVDVMSP